MIDNAEDSHNLMNKYVIGVSATVTGLEFDETAYLQKLTFGVLDSKIPGSLDDSAADEFRSIAQFEEHGEGYAKLVYADAADAAALESFHDAMTAT